MQRSLISTLFAATLAVATLWSSDASATLIEAGSIEELAAQADDVVVGEVIGLEPFLRDGHVYTRVSVATEDGAAVEILAYGGRTEHLATRVAGAEGYSMGEHVLVLVERLDSGELVSLGMSFTKFELVERAGVIWAVRDFDAAELVEFDAATHQMATPTLAFPREIRLDELAARLETVRGPLPQLVPVLPTTVDPVIPGTPVGQ